MNTVASRHSERFESLAVALARRARRRRSAILAYHGVAALSPDLDPGRLCIDPARFRSHVRMLSEAGYELVTVGDYVRRSPAADGGAGAVAITFDDGLANLVSEALPVLREFGAPATVYVPTGLIGEPYPWALPEAGLRIATAEELDELVSAGWEIGSHTINHPDLAKCSFDECESEMRGSRATLEELTGAPVETFAYPFASSSPTAERAAEEVGFLAALSYSIYTEGNRRFALPRELVTPQHGPVSLALKVSGLYDRLMASGLGALARRLSAPLRKRPEVPPGPGS